MRILAGLAPAATMMVATSAYADWQWTQWGMTLDEVRAAAAEAGFSLRDPQVTLAGFRFRAEFLFESERLLPFD